MVGHGENMTPNPDINLVHLAVEAAGGTQRVASECGLTRQAISGWVHRRSVPVRWAAALCAAGHDIVRVDALLAFILAHRSGKIAARMTAAVKGQGA